MNTSNEGQNQPNNMELLKQQAENGGCGSGCGCHSSTSSCKVRWGICAVVLIVAVAGVLVARGLNKTDEASAKTDSSGFAMPAVTPEATPTVAESPPETAAAVEAQPAETVAGVMIGAFEELNTVAAESDAVFLYLPGKEADSSKAPSTAMEAAARTLGTRGTRCGIFTLKPGSADHEMIGSQMGVPGVLALVKGRGMIPVSGEITEAKLVQGFLAAASAGGCGGGGSALGGCP